MENLPMAGPYTLLERSPETGGFEIVQVGAPTAKMAGPASASPMMFEEASPQAQHVLILGGGVAGLTAAYDLLKSRRGFKVTLLEANKKVGGRSLTLRKGDSFTEEFVDNQGKPQVITQTCTFDAEPTDPDYAPYLNAGPGRIPSGHRRVLDLCRELNVELEVYVMESRSNLFYRNGAFGGKSMVNRRIANDTRGFIANDLYHFLNKKTADLSEEDQVAQQNYLDLLKNFGALHTEKVQGKPDVVSYKGSQRSGFSVQPGTQPGSVETPINKHVLLHSKFWEDRFYQPEDFLWQATSFQPVGGMDQIEIALEKAIEKMQPGAIVKEAFVTRIMRQGYGFKVTYTKAGRTLEANGDFCLSNIPLPLLKDKINYADFEVNYRRALQKVVENEKFLRPTCKVGWQAERKLWQNPKNRNTVPIFGGISFTADENRQIWYPSDKFYHQYGVLTGAYNMDSNDGKIDTATKWGKMTPAARIEIARKAAENLHGEEFSKGLRHGISIAWQNIPTLKGGWVEWEFIPGNNETRVALMNLIRKGDNGFYVIGDQVSGLPGWKEGAVASALEVFARTTKVRGYILPEFLEVPNTEALTQGYMY